MHLRSSRRAALLIAFAAVATAGCGEAVDITQTAGVEIAAPPGLATPGRLTVAVPADLPPYGYRSSGGSQGLAVDLGTAMATRMGLKLSVVALDPQDLAAAARGGGVDVVLGAIESSTTVPAPPDLSLVPYVKEQTDFVIPQGSAFQPHELGELCGRNVTFVAGTPQERLVGQAVRLCGGAPPGLVAAPTNTAALAALHHGTAAVYLADSATAAFDEARSGDVTTTGAKVGATELAMGMRTGGTPLTDAITRDFYLVHSDGTYEVLLQKWGMTAEDL